MRLLARDSEAERWFSVLLRSLHLAGVVWLGAAVLGAPAGHSRAALLVLVAPFAVVGLAALGFVDNWLRSQPPARSAAT